MHGFPKVMGVLTHLDGFRDTKALKKTKKALKHRFWTEIYQGGCRVERWQWLLESWDALLSLGWTALSWRHHRFTRTQTQALSLYVDQAPSCSTSAASRTAST